MAAVQRSSKAQPAVAASASTEPTPVRRHLLPRSDGGRYRQLTRALGEEGDVTVTSHEVGASLAAAWGADDHEVTLSLAPEAARLAFVLLAEDLKGRADGFERLVALCERHGVDHLHRHRELLIWMNEQVNAGAPSAYSAVVEKMSADLLSRMTFELGLRFANQADRDALAQSLSAIYQRLNFAPLDRFKWDGQRDFFSMWHYVKGCFGSCLVPQVAYSF